MGQYNDHARSRKHRHNLNKRIGHEQRDRRDKGLAIPRGTALIIEQGSILRDAAEQYTLRLYSRAAAQAAKAAPQGSDVGPSTYAGPAATSQGGPADTAQGGEDVPIMLLELKMEITEIRISTELLRTQCAVLRRELRRMEKKKQERHQRLIQESLEATRPSQSSSSGIQRIEVEQTDAEKTDRERKGIAERLQEITRIEEEAAGILERKRINEKEIIERQTRELHERQLRQEEQWAKQEAELAQDNRRIENMTINHMHATGRSHTESRMIVIDSMKRKATPNPFPQRFLYGSSDPVIGPMKMNAELE